MPIQAGIGAGLWTAERCSAAARTGIEGPSPIAQAPPCPFLVGGARPNLSFWRTVRICTLCTLSEQPHPMAGCAIIQAAFGVVLKRGSGLHETARCHHLSWWRRGLADRGACAARQAVKRIGVLNAIPADWPPSKTPLNRSV